MLDQSFRGILPWNGNIKSNILIIKPNKHLVMINISQLYLIQFFMVGYHICEYFWDRTYGVIPVLIYDKSSP